MCFTQPLQTVLLLNFLFLEYLGSITCRNGIKDLIKQGMTTSCAPIGGTRNNNLPDKSVSSAILYEIVFCSTKANLKYPLF